MKLKSAEPFWLVKNGILNSYPSLRENLKTDVLIIGAGITGALMAHECIKQGYQTVVIDRREVANGSTSATTSMLQYEIDVPLFQLKKLIGEEAAVQSYRDCSAAIDRLAEIAKEINSTSGFAKKESLFYAEKKDDIDWLKKEFEERNKNGFAVKWMAAPEITLRYGFGENYGGILSEQGGSIDAFIFTHDLLKWNQQQGLKVYDKTTAENIKYREDGVSVLTTYGNTIDAKKLIFCNGFESTEIIRTPFVKLISTWAIITEPVEVGLAGLMQTLFWSSGQPYLYLRTTDDNRLLVGGMDEDFVNTEKRDAIVAEKAEELLGAANQLIPGMDFRLDFSWAGTFGETKDGLPFIGPHPGFPSTYFLLGFGGNGITFSVTGTKLITAMLKGNNPSAAIPYRFNR